jgi:hypothetical protein
MPVWQLLEQVQSVLHPGGLIMEQLSSSWVNEVDAIDGGAAGAPPSSSTSGGGNGGSASASNSGAADSIVGSGGAGGDDSRGSEAGPGVVSRRGSAAPRISQAEALMASVTRHITSSLVAAVRTEDALLLAQAIEDVHSAKDFLEVEDDALTAQLAVCVAARLASRREGAGACAWAPVAGWGCGGGSGEAVLPTCCALQERGEVPCSWAGRRVQAPRALCLGRLGAVATA